jgi:hypothetical protein
VNFSRDLGALSQSFPLADGDAGIEQTIDAMRTLIDEAKRDFTLNQVAGSLISRIPSQRQEQRAKAIFDAVLGRISFVEDIYGAETLRPPLVTWQQGFGDCDDIVMLMAALLQTVGYNVRLVTVAAEPQAVQDGVPQFSHVYGEVECPMGSDRWIAVDAARPGARFGRDDGNYPRKRIWSLESDDYWDTIGGDACMRGLGYFGDLGDASTIDELVSEIPAIEGGAAQIVTAANPPPAAVAQPALLGISGSGWLIGLGLVAVVLFAMHGSGGRRQNPGRRKRSRG